MQQLCFMTNVSGEQWAAWGQAVISGFAIVGSFFLARKFQLDELKRLEIQHKQQITLLEQSQLESIRRDAESSHHRTVRTLELSINMLRHLRKTCQAFSRGKDYDELLRSMVLKTLEDGLTGIEQIPIFELPPGDFTSKVFRCRNGCRGLMRALAIAQDDAFINALERIEGHVTQAIEEGEKCLEELKENHKAAFPLKTSK
jgi:hypothetical protein